MILLSKENVQNSPAKRNRWIPKSFLITLPSIEVQKCQRLWRELPSNTLVPFFSTWQHKMTNYPGNQTRSQWSHRRLLFPHTSSHWNPLQQTCPCLKTSKELLVSDEHRVMVMNWPYFIPTASPGSLFATCSTSVPWNYWNHWEEGKIRSG
jgi:hypothetical protein